MSNSARALRNRRFGLAWQLLTSVAVCSVAIVFGLVLVINDFVADSLRERYRVRTAQLDETFAELITERTRQLETHARSLGLSPVLRALLTSDVDRATIEDAVGSMLSEPEVPFYQIATGDGQKLLAQRTPPSEAATVAVPPGHRGLWQVGDEIFLVTTTTVSFGPGADFSVAVGRRAEQALLAPAQRVSRAEWFLVAGDVVAATSSELRLPDSVAESAPSSCAATTTELEFHAIQSSLYLVCESAIELRLGPRKVRLLAALDVGPDEHVITGTARRIQLVGLFGVLVLLGTLALMLRIIVLRPIHELHRGLTQLGAGRLWIDEIKGASRNELGDMTLAFNTLLRQLRGFVARVAEMVLRINASAEQILATSRRQELGATRQSSSVDETRRTMSSVLESAREIASASEGVLETAQRTLDINEQIAGHTGELSAQMRRIGEILEVIREIALKSELLALNAALEGTRAGVAGRGFSLVAVQMQQLAERVSRAVDGVAALSKDIHRASDSSILATEEGTRLAGHTTEAARRISLITRQQQSGTEGIKDAMDEIHEVVQETQVANEQLSEAMLELRDLSGKLRSLVAHLHLDPEERPRGASAPGDSLAHLPAIGWGPLDGLTEPGDAQSEAEPTIALDEV